MEWQAWFTIGVVLVLVGFLTLSRISVDLVMLGTLLVLWTAGVVEAPDALSGFANEGVITVGALFVVAAGLRDTGAVSLLAQRALGRPRSVAGAQARLMLPVAAMSAFMNNTPLVAVMLPLVADWAKRTKIAPSKLMIPLSFATILGGLCTLIGTSTNLVVAGLVLAAGLPPLSMFEVTWVGLPCAVAGLGYMLVFSRWLLPDRGDVLGEKEDPRQYTVEMLVEPGSALDGQTIEQAGLRHLPGLYLVEIDRKGELLAAVAPHERLRGHDRLVFAGVVESVTDLQKIRGLKPATDQVFKLDSPRTERCLIEAVVSDSCPLVGRSIREGRFRTVYNAAVIAAARNGQRLRQKVGDVVLQPGDTLLLEAHPAFLDRQRHSRDFYLVSRVEGFEPPRHERAWAAAAVLAGLVVVAGFGWLPMVHAALLAALLMVLLRCVSEPTARGSVNWEVLLVIAAALGIGRAMQTSGAAPLIARHVMGLLGNEPWLALAGIYLLAMLFTEILSNNAAAVLVFPIALATARTLEVSPMPFIMSLMMAASCGFATPIGYQTNLMVYGPGGYRFGDYVRFGGPLNLVVAAVTIGLAPLIWPFRPA